MRIQLSDQFSYTKLLRYSLPSIIMTVFTSIYGIMDGLFVSNFAGKTPFAAISLILPFVFAMGSVGLLIIRPVAMAMGCAPIISYHYGAENHVELKNLYRKSLVLVGAGSVLLTAVGVIFSPSIARFFVGYDPVLLTMSKRAFALYAVSFLICGFNIFGSAFFTALNNGLISATISFARTFFFQALAIIVLPLFLGLDGIWLAVVAAEAMALALAVFFFIRKKKQYHYA